MRTNKETITIVETSSDIFEITVAGKTIVKQTIQEVVNKVSNIVSNLNKHNIQIESITYEKR